MGECCLLVLKVSDHYPHSVQESRVTCARLLKQPDVVVLIAESDATRWMLHWNLVAVVQESVLRVEQGC